MRRKSRRAEQISTLISAIIFAILIVSGFTLCYRMSPQIRVYDKAELIYEGNKYKCYIGTAGASTKVECASSLYRIFFPDIVRVSDNIKVINK